MWIEKTLLKRKAASRDAAVRKAAVAAMPAEDFRETLLELAASDPVPEVRLAAMMRLTAPADLEKLRSHENDPAVRQALVRKLDLLYSEDVLASEMCDGEAGDTLDRIESPEILLETALRAATVPPVLAIGAKLAPHEALLRKLLCGLSSDRAAVELYRNLGGRADWEDEVIGYARSAALRELAAAERSRRMEDAEHRKKLLALVERAEALEHDPDAASFEELSRQWREAECGDETLKTRFLAAKYRHFQALESRLAAERAWERDRALSMRLVMDFAVQEGAENWNGCAELAAEWRRNKLDEAPGAAEFKERFHALLEQFEARRQALRQVEDAALTLARRILSEFSAAAAQGRIPALDQRQAALNALGEAEKTLENPPVEWVDLKEKIMELDREFRRRFRAENQVRDLARWEHYTRKMDICLELEKLAAADGDLVQAAKRFRVLRGRWRELGAVPQEKAEELKERYRKVCGALHERMEAFFAARDEQFRRAESEKSAICAEAETLSGSEDWEPTSERLKELQTRWKNLPAAAPARERELFARFHAACDAFFVRRNSAWESRKRAFMAAAARKRELCEKAEALKDQPFPVARRAIADLREAWHAVPSAGRDDRTLYGEFNRIIDGIYAAHRETEDEAKRRSEIVCTALLELVGQTERRELTLEEIERKFAENQREWEAVGGRPAPEAARRRSDALRKLHTLLARLRHEAARNRLEDTLHREEFSDDDPDDVRLGDHLARREAVCRELENRLKECRIVGGGPDLAGELELAIAGNFGGGRFALTMAELDDFLRRFVAVGPVPAQNREEVFARFSGLYRQALDYLERGEGGRSDGELQN